MKSTTTKVAPDAARASPPAEVEDAVPKTPRRRKLPLKEAIALNKAVSVRTVIIHGKDGKYSNGGFTGYSLHSPPAGVTTKPGLELEYQKRLIHFVDQGLNYFGTIMYEGEVLKEACDQIRKWGLFLIYRTFPGKGKDIDCSMTIGGCKGAQDVLTIVKKAKEEGRRSPGMCWYMQMARMVLFAWNEDAFIEAITETARKQKKKIPIPTLEPFLAEVPDLAEIKFRKRNAFSDYATEHEWERRGKQYAIAGTTQALPRDPESV